MTPLRIDWTASLPDDIFVIDVEPALSRDGHEPGKIHTWTFDQDELWIDNQGYEHRLMDMDIEYIKNVLVFLQNGAERFRWAYTTQHAAVAYDEASAPGPSWDPTVFNQHARRWLLDLPLVQRLMEIAVDAA